MQPNNKKVIIFLHFHKSGGTFINKLFINYNKYIKNRNGNPWTPDNTKIIKFWNYNRTQFDNFINKCKYENVEFLSLEWNFFKFYNDLNYNNIQLITCIREPYQRFKSNMNYDSCFNYKDYINKTILWSRKNVKQNFNVNYNKYNYYVKMLNGFGDLPDIKITNTHLEIAKRNLEKFTTIIILEDINSFQLLTRYKINPDNQEKKNAHKYSRNINILSIDEFKKENFFDYQLYEYAKKLSNHQLKQLKDNVNISLI